MQKRQEAESSKVFMVLELTQEEQQTLAAVLSAPSTIVPVAMAPFMASIIQKFNLAAMQVNRGGAQVVPSVDPGNNGGGEDRRKGRK